MNKTSLFLFVLCFLSQIDALTAQDNTNHIYFDNIRTVRFHPVGSPTTLPFVSLGGDGELIFYFDDVDGERKDYSYTIEHCNHDWTPSDLAFFEYANGFQNVDINDFEFSYRSFSNFAHYKLFLPNDNISFTQSGNYLLKVYEEDDGGEKHLSIVRRFLVVEQTMGIRASMNLPAKVSKQRTHQEIDFTVSTKKDAIVKNPLTEISATVLQNGRWDNAITNLKPVFLKGTDLVFDHQDKIVFPSSKEWRFVDLRSLRFPHDGIEVERVDGGYDAYVNLDRKRAYLPYLSFNDFNGEYIIENRDDPRIPINKYYQKDHHLTGEYILTYFGLESPTELLDHDVYLFGALTDWELKEEFKLDYIAEKQYYETGCWLKQGYYDYLYAAVPKGTNIVDLEELEGNWYETKNDYYILVYYRPIGQRFDRLTAIQFLSSNR